MTIEGLGPIDAISKYNKTSKNEKPLKKGESDSINVSPESKAMSELYRATEEVKQTNDIRLDKINEIKEKLKDPNYINDRVIGTIADKLMDLFEI